MRNGMKRILFACLGVAILQPALWAADDKPELKDQKSKISYGIGMNIGNNLKRSGYDLDVDVLSGAIRDVLGGKEPKMTEAQAREVLTSYAKERRAKQEEERQKREEERQKKAPQNRKEGEEFLAENKKKEGVKTHMVALPGGKTAELQYKVL